VTRVQLTPREMATLTLLADGKANKEIASALDISERTVKTHLAHLFEKLGATSRTEAVKVATRPRPGAAGLVHRKSTRRSHETADTHRSRLHACAAPWSGRTAKGRLRSTPATFASLQSVGPERSRRRARR